MLYWKLFHNTRFWVKIIQQQQNEHPQKIVQKKIPNRKSDLFGFETSNTKSSIISKQGNQEKFNTISYCSCANSGSFTSILPGMDTRVLAKADIKTHSIVKISSWCCQWLLLDQQIKSWQSSDLRRERGVGEKEEATQQAGREARDPAAWQQKASWWELFEAPPTLRLLQLFWAHLGRKDSP